MRPFSYNGCAPYLYIHPGAWTRGTVGILILMLCNAASFGERDQKWHSDATKLVRQLEERVKLADDSEPPLARGPTSIRRDMFRLWALTGFAEPIVAYRPEEIFRRDTAEHVVAAFDLWLMKQANVELVALRRRNVDLLASALDSEYPLGAYDIFYRWFEVEPGYVPGPLHEADLFSEPKVLPETRAALKEAFGLWYKKYRGEIVWNAEREVFVRSSGKRLPDPFKDIEIEYITPVEKPVDGEVNKHADENSRRSKSDR